MASYRIIKDQVTLPKKVGDRFSARNPKKKVDLKQHIVYRQGQIVKEEDIAPEIIKLFKDNDERTLTLIELVPEKEESEK